VERRRADHIRARRLPPYKYTRLLDTDSGRVVRRLDSTGGWELATPGPSRDGRLLATKRAVGGAPIEVDVTTSS
jgi:hypothetical protein